MTNKGQKGSRESAAEVVEPSEQRKNRRQPSRVVVILLDSLNRHLLGAYGGREFATPNLDRLARRALRFTRHYAGSLPCMPARHDLLCGALDFLWKPWGSIEIWERPLTAYLRRAGVVTQLFSDHPHLFEVGGENYHTDFSAWDYQRGHESDPWRTRPDPSWLGAPSFSRGHMPYDNSRGYFRGEADFPGPRTMAAAARWLEEDAPTHERFLLLVDEFDPHEPFDTPEPYASLYDPDWRGPHLIWPPYMRGARGGRRAVAHRGAAGARLLRRQADDDRCLVGTRPRRARPAPALGQHGSRAVHRPRALPGREGHLGQTAGAGVRAARAHPAAHRLARGCGGARSTR